MYKTVFWGNNPLGGILMSGSKRVIILDKVNSPAIAQAIFILKENAQSISDEMLLKEAKRIINIPQKQRRFYGPMWACCGAVGTGIIWLFTIFL
jgi:hypothetical protein